MTQKNILAVVPARGGSKGIPKKNLSQVGGASLIEHVAKVIMDVPLITRAVLSTDDRAIANAGIAAGLDVPFMRPDRLSGDLVGDVDVLSHALQEIERVDEVKYDAVVMLQPTSPMRTSRHVMDCIEKFLSGQFDAVWTISQTDTKDHPLKQLKLLSNGDLNFYDQSGKDIIARQQLTPVYHRNGVAYVVGRDCLLEQKTLMGMRTGSLLLDDEHVSIDTPQDLALVEFLFSQQLKNIDP
jgi:CMP-N-acetylneuraminic acid synthetase